MSRYFTLLVESIKIIEESKNDLAIAKSNHQEAIHKTVSDHISKPNKFSKKVLQTAASNSHTNLETLRQIVRHNPSEYSKHILENPAFTRKLMYNQIPQHYYDDFLTHIDPDAYTRTNKDVYDFLYTNASSKNVKDEHMRDVAAKQEINHHIMPVVSKHITDFKRTHSDAGDSISDFARNHGHKGYIANLLDKRSDGKKNAEKIEIARNENPITQAIKYNTFED